MKICLINNLYKPYNRGGTEQIMELTANGIKNANHNIFIISTKPIFKKYQNNKKEQASKHKIYYIKSLYYNLNAIPKALRLFWHIIDMFNIANYLKIKSILKKEKPNLIITNNLKGISFLIPYLIKKLNIKHIHIIHDIQLLHPSGLMLYGKEKIINNYFSNIYININRKLFSYPSVIISPSKWLMKTHTNKKFFENSKQLILQNPFPKTSIFKNTKTQKQNTFFNFLYVGQIEHHKGILFLIKTFKKISNNNCILIIIGTGTKFNYIKKITKNIKNIKILGHQPNSNIQNIMFNADCLIVPSLCYENSPTVIYEAILTGLPVIASRIGGIPELINNLGGILFNPNDEKNLLKKMKLAMKENKQKSIFTNAKKYYIEKYISELINN